MSFRDSVLRVWSLPLRWPRLVVLVAGVLTVLAAFGWSALRLQPDVSRLLPGDHPHTAIHERLAASERPSRALWILLRGDDLPQRIEAIALRLRASPLVAAVAATRDELFGGAVADAATAPLWTFDDATLQRLAEALSPAGLLRAATTLREDLADDPIAARDLAVQDPLGLRWLLAPLDPAVRFRLRADTPFVVLAAADGRDVALLRLTGHTDAYDAEYSTTLLAHVDAVLGDVEHERFGGYAVARADQARLRADFERASTWSVLAIAIYLVWSMRGLRLPLLVQLPALLAIAWSVPLAGAWLGPLPTVAVAAVAVLVGLGVDFAIHYAARYRAARLHADHAQAVQQVQRSTVPELLIDMATTAVTFVAIGFGQRGGLAAFGWLLALGLCASVLVTTTLLPVLLRFAGERRSAERSLLASLADRWLAARLARPVAAGALAMAVVVAAVVAWRGVPLSADGDALRPAHDPVLLARARIEAATRLGTVPCAVLWPVAVDASPLWSRLHRLQQDGRVAFWSGLDRQDTAAGSTAVAAFRRTTAGFATAAGAALAQVGLDVELLRPAIAANERSFAADPPPRAPSLVDLPQGTMRVVTVWPTGTLDRAAFAALAHDVQEHAGAAAVVHGAPTLTDALEQVLRTDLQRAMGLALLFAFTMVALWLRSLRHGLLALVPAMFGLASVLGVLLATGVPLSMVSFVAIPFVLGIGVDEGVHLVGHFRHGALTTGATGVGVVRTSVGTTLGFLALAFAESPGLRELGALTALGSLASMFGCLFVLAPFLRRVGAAPKAVS